MSNIKTYKCLNDNCEMYVKSKKKRRRVLFKGVVTGDSFVIARCPGCGEELAVNTSEVDSTPKSVIDLLKVPRANA